MVHSRSKWVNSETWGSYIGRCLAPYTALSHQCLIFSCLAEERQKKMLRHAVGIIWRGMFVRCQGPLVNYSLAQRMLGNGRLKGYVAWFTLVWASWKERSSLRECEDFLGVPDLAGTYEKLHWRSRDKEIQRSYIEGPVGVNVMFVTLSLLTIFQSIFPSTK